MQMIIIVEPPAWLTQIGLTTGQWLNCCRPLVLYGNTAVKKRMIFAAYGYGNERLILANFGLLMCARVMSGTRILCLSNCPMTRTKRDSVACYTRTHEQYRRKEKDLFFKTTFDHLFRGLVLKNKLFFLNSS